ncbi:MAG TPA: SDR family NAD(P)-dependent oxidoreductase [Pseudomonadales bacterium]|nr:SDR family NAD(P)-dependent oxidoreductase [Pseudomonadales bacterium]
MTFAHQYGPWALITGSGNGLGAEFALQTAQRGIHVVLVDIDAEGLKRTEDTIRQQTHQLVRSVCCDLTHPDSVNQIATATTDIEIGLLINNAGISALGLFLEKPLPDHLQVIELNIRLPLQLSHLFGLQMRERKRGGIIFISSLSALQGTAYVANYAATKAWNLIIAEGLWAELKPHGIDVLGFLVGSTRTPGFMNSQPKLQRATVPVMEIPPTVKDALDALGQQPSAVAGKLNRLITPFLQRFLKRKHAIQLISKTMQQLYGDA